MADVRAALPRFAFSRRDPGALLALAEQRRRQGAGIRVLALGGQPRDRVYCAQLLAEAAGDAFVQIDLALAAADPADEKAALEKLSAFARTAPVTVFIDGAETLFARSDAPPGGRAKLLGDYLRRTLVTLTGGVVLGMPERVDPDYDRLPALDMEVTFRAPSGHVIAGRPILLPAHTVDEALLPAHNFAVEIEGVDVGLCAVSAPRLLAGPYSEFDFDPARQGIAGFAALDPALREHWPTVTLRRGVTQSRLFYEWKQAQSLGKPLRRDVRIRQLDWPGVRVVNTWRLTNCWARRWTGPPFDARNVAVAEEEIELYYEDVAWE